MKLIVNILKKHYFKLRRSILKRIDPYPNLRQTKKRGFIFIHITKTAGTSIVDALGLPFRHHEDYTIFRAANPVLFTKSFKFCFVRNPYSRAVSTYLYLKNGGAGKTDVELCEYIRENSTDFGSFVENILNQDIIHTQFLFKPQFTFVCDFKFRIMMDFVGRFENIEEDWKHITTKIKIKKPLDKLNSQNEYNYKDYYTEKSAQIIYSLYKKDFELFNYQLNSYK